MNDIQLPLYAVALHGCPGLSISERIASEVRYCDALERALGSNKAVVQTLMAVNRLAVDDGGINADQDAEDRQRVARWLVVTTEASRAGFKGIDATQDAWFEASLVPRV